MFAHEIYNNDHKKIISFNSLWFCFSVVGVLLCLDSLDSCQLSVTLFIIWYLLNISKENCNESVIFTQKHPHILRITITTKVYPTHSFRDVITDLYLRINLKYVSVETVLFALGTCNKLQLGKLLCLVIELAAFKPLLASRTLQNSCERINS